MLGYLPLVPFDGVVGIVNDAEGGFVRSLGRRLKDKIVSVWTARFKYVEGNYVEDDDATWTLGAAFFSSHCVAYDWEAHTIGFAKAK
ncbi:hypothetical protein AAVH_08510 [Aphelenchoides avenae]|nr:hypothetical protein AAVH_08510 [Aphelenchus avenae]